MMDKETFILHKSSERGFSDHGWLKSAFSFSFADWYEPTRMGFESLRVINDDSIAPKKGFGFHPHQDMEIVTFMLEGELTHQDTMGNKETIKPGEVQRMSAGKGVLHSEINDHSEDYAKLFQVWITTKRRGIEPSYEQKFFDFKERRNKFQLLVSPDGRDNSLKIHQDAFISRIDLDEGVSISYKKYRKDTSLYILVVEGEISISDFHLKKRDALGISGVEEISLSSSMFSDVLLFEVPNI